MNEILLILGMLAFSFIAVHLWIAFWDTVGKGIKRLFGIKPKKVNWHELNTNNIQVRDKEDCKVKKEIVETREE